MIKTINISFINIVIIIFLLTIILNSLSLNNKFIHPTLIGNIIILIRIIISLNLRTYFFNHWFSFIIFLTISRGLIIIFIYFIRFISNIKISINNSSITHIILLNIIITTLILIIINLNLNFIWFNSIETKNLINNYINLINFNFTKINFIYYYNKNISTIISIIYLFFCLTLIVKICLINKYSLRKIN